MASSTPINSASFFSKSKCASNVPKNPLGPQLPTPYFRIPSFAAVLRSSLFKNDKKLKLPKFKHFLPFNVISSPGLPSTVRILSVSSSSFSYSGVRGSGFQSSKSNIKVFDLIK